MKSLLSFMKKEFFEAARTGKLIILLLLFVLFGIMNPAIAKLTPWMMEMFADTMAESGFIITDIQVDAMTSWTQFFKNIPMALIAFVLIYSDIFTKEYKSGTLLLILTKGLSRYKVLLSKTVLLLSLWTLGYGLCFAITYGYNAYFWDNNVANNLFLAAFIWWLFGIWVISLIVLFSAVLENNTGVSLCTGGIVLLAYVFGIIPKIQPYTPMMLMDTASLMTGAEGIDTYIKAIFITAVLSVVCIVISIPIINKKQL